MRNSSLLNFYIMTLIEGAIEGPGFKLSLKMSMSEADGLSWAADFVAFKMKKVQPELGYCNYRVDIHCIT